MIKSVKVFPFFLLHKNQTPRHKHAKCPPSDLTPWTITLAVFLFFIRQKLVSLFQCVRRRPRPDAFKFRAKTGSFYP